MTAIPEISYLLSGAIAQLVARLHGMQEVSSSNLDSSTNPFKDWEDFLENEMLLVFAGRLLFSVLKSEIHHQLLKFF